MRHVVLGFFVENAGDPGGCDVPPAPGWPRFAPLHQHQCYTPHETSRWTSGWKGLWGSQSSLQAVESPTSSSLCFCSSGEGDLPFLQNSLIGLKMPLKLVTKDIYIDL